MVIVGVDFDLEELVYFVDGLVDIELVVGDWVWLVVMIGSCVYVELVLDVYLISFWGIWEWIGLFVFGVVLFVWGMVKLVFDVILLVWLEFG